MAGANKLLTAGGGGVILTPATSIGSDVTVQIPSRAGNLAVDGPAFSAYQSVAQSMTGGVFTKLTFTTSEFDTTSGMFASSRFTPTIAGYYQIIGAFHIASTVTQVVASIYKNGAAYKDGIDATSAGSSYVGALVFFNGSTDYVEIYGYSGTTQNTGTGQNKTYFQAVMVRSA